jgi:hypothetical protein
LDLNSIKSNTLDSYYLTLNEFGDRNTYLSNVKLIPAGIWLLKQESWLKLMMEKREENKKMYFSRFDPSLNSLVKYLFNGPISDKNRILFLIVDDNRFLYGHLGLKLNSAGYCELDNVLKLNSKIPNLMRIATEKLLIWATMTLNINEYRLKVISTNQKALKLYDKIGFTFLEKMPLKFVKISHTEIQLIPSTFNNSNTLEEMIILQKFFDLSNLDLDKSD